MVTPSNSSISSAPLPKKSTGFAIIRNLIAQDPKCARELFLQPDTSGTYFKDIPKIPLSAKTLNRIMEFECMNEGIFEI